ncbi:TadE family type IV pilus minor pilin [Subtercola sp. YIM 133946]|uniref:TadE family type IV pilus minor pilin n=1 Tax=Subtercola sp. YIM 133946 TaxID=3118909 RepID=UPI002F92E50B
MTPLLLRGTGRRGVRGVRGALRSALADDSGTVTAEFAVALPAAVVVFALAVGAVQASALQVRVVDAASVAARTLGRGAAAGEADARVAQLVGAHTLSTSADGDFVCVTVTAPIAFAALAAAGVDVSARSCALAGGQ